MASNTNYKSAKIRSYSKNAAKSIAYSSLNVLKAVTPNITNTVTNVSDSARDVGNFISRAKGQIAQQGSLIDSSKLGRSAKDIFNSAMNDIKSGDYSLKRASDDAFDTYDDVFGDIDVGSDDTSEEEIKEANLGRAITAGTASNIESIRKMTNVLANTQIKSAKLSSDRTMNVALFGINTLNASLTGINHRLDTINSNLVSMIKFQNENVSVTNQAMLQYFDQTSKLMTNLVNPTKSRSKNNSLDFLFNGIDVKGYAKHVKRNFDNSLIGSMANMMQMMFSMSSMGEKPRATKMILEGALSKLLLGSNLKRRVGSFDKNFNDYLEAGLYRLGDIGKDYSKKTSPVLRFLAEMLGAERPSVSKYSLTGYNKDSMMWNGEDHHTLVEVIPTYLSRMDASLSALANLSEYDMAKNRRVFGKNGKLQTMKSLGSQYHSDVKSAMKSSFYDVGDTLDQISKRMEMSEKENESLRRELSILLQDRVMKNTGNTSEYRTKFGNIARKHGLSQQDIMKLARQAERGSNDAASRLSSIQTDLNNGSAYRNLFNTEGYEAYQGARFKNGNMFTDDSFLKLNPNEVINDIINTLSGQDTNNELLRGFSFKVTSSLYSSVNRAISDDASMSELQSIVKKEYNRQRKIYITNKFRMKSLHENADAKIIGGIDKLEGGVFRTTMGSEYFGKSSNGSRKASSRASASGLGVGSTIGNPNSHLAQQMKYIPKTKEEMENMSIDDISSSIQNSRDGMAYINKSTPEHAIPQGASINGVTDNLVNSQAALMDSLTQTVVSLHSGSMGVLSGLFGKSGFFRNFMQSNWMKDNVNKLKSYLFDENSGIFSNMTKSFYDVADYMKYVFNGKAYTDRKGETHEDTDNAVFKYLKSGYNKALGFTMQHLFGDDYESNESYQKYFSWLGGSAARNRSAKAVADKKKYSYSSNSTVPAGMELAVIDKDGKSTTRVVDTNNIDEVRDIAVSNIANTTSTALCRINEGTTAIGNVMLGKGNDTTDKAEKSFSEKFKENLPKSLTAGIAGAGISLLAGGHMGLLGLFLPNSLIGGAIVGMGLQIASKSKHIQEFLFGKEEDGEKTEGLITSKMQSTFKKALPTVVGGAVVGAITKGGLVKHIPGVGLIANTLLPGGILGGALLGLGTSILANNDTIKDILFGPKTEDGKRHEGLSHLFSGTKKVFASVIPYATNGLKGAAIGAGTGLVLSNMGVLGAAMSLGGPIGMGIMGLGMGIASQTKRFQSFLFGDEDPDHPGKKLKNGLFDKVRVMLQVNVFEPIADSLKHNAKQFAYWAKGKIILPFLEVFQPIKNQFQDIGAYIKDKVDVLSDGIRHVVGGFFKKMFSPVTKLLGKVISGVATGTQIAMRVALSPLSGVLGLAKLGLAPKKEMRDMKFKASYLRGQYGDSNRGFIQRLGDVFGIRRDAGGEDGDYFNAHKEFAAEMAENGKRTTNWDYKIEGINNRKAARLENKEYNQQKALQNLRQSTITKWGNNESVLLSPREIRRMQNELSKGKYGNINPEGIQTEDDIKQLIFHRDKWNERFGKNANAATINSTEGKTEKYQSTVEDKLTTIANLISQAFFHKNAYKKSHKSTNAQSNTSSAFDNSSVNTESNAANSASSSATNNLLVGMMQIMSNGRAKAKNIKDIIMGKKITDSQGTAWGSSSEEIGTNVAMGIGAIIGKNREQDEKEDAKAAKLAEEEAENLESKSGTKGLLDMPSDKEAEKILANSKASPKAKEAAKGSIFKRMLLKTGNFFGGVFDGITGVFKNLFGSNPKDIIGNLGMTTLFGVGTYGLFKTFGGAILDKLEVDHPKIFDFITNKVTPFFTDTIPTWWKETATPFITEKLPDVIASSTAAIAKFFTDNSAMLVSSISTVFTAIVPVVGQALAKTIGNLFSYMTGGKPMTAEQNVEANAQGINTVNTGKVDSNGNPIYIRNRDQLPNNVGASIAKTGIVNTVSALGIAKDAFSSANLAKAGATTMGYGADAIKAAGQSAANAVIKSSTKTSGGNIIYKILVKAKGVLAKALANEKVMKILDKVDGLSGATVKGMNELIEKMLKTLATKDAGFISRLAAKWSTRLTTKEGASLIGSTPYLAIGYYGYNILSGATNAERLFNINSDAVTMPMRIISALFSGFFATPYGAFLDIAFSIGNDLMGYDAKCALATIIYKLIASDIDDQLLDQAQNELEQETIAFNNANQTSLTTGQYSEKKNKTFIEGLWNNTKKLFGMKSADTNNYDIYEADTKALIKNGGRVTANIGVTVPIGSTTKSVTTTQYTTTSYDKSGNIISSNDVAGYGSAMAQGDSRWSNYKLGTLPNGKPSTMASGGCGPTALSTAAKAIGYGQDMSPVGIAKFAQQNGYIQQGGSTSDLFTNGASRLGMNSKPIDANGIEDSIKSGRPVIISGRSAYGPGASPYTRAGHIVTATGYDKHGNIIVDNPQSGNKEVYSKSQLSSGMTGAWSLGRKNSGYGYGPYYGYGGLYYGTSSGEPFSKMSELVVTKWGSAYTKGGASKTNPFGLSNKELKFKISYTYLCNLQKRSLSLSSAIEAIKRSMAVTGGAGIVNTAKYITYQKLNDAYANSINNTKKSPKLNFYQYASILKLLGIINYYLKSYTKGGSGNRSGATAFSSMELIHVIKWGTGYPKSVTKKNPFGLGTSDMAGSIGMSAVTSLYDKWLLSTNGYKLVKSFMHGKSNGESTCSIKDIHNAFVLEKIPFCDYACLLRASGVVSFVAVGDPNTSIGASGDTEDEALFNQESSVGVGSLTAVTGFLGKLKNLVSAMGLIGDRAINSIGTEEGYQRVYDDNGNPIDQDFINNFNDMLIYGTNSNSQAEEDSINNGTFTKAINGKGGAGETRTKQPELINSAAKNFIGKYLRTIMGVYDQYNVMPSILLGQAGAESSYGTNTKGSNNAFWITSTKKWKENGGASTSNGKFRSYSTLNDSILDYGKLIGTSSIYKDITQANTYRDALKLSAFGKYCYSKNDPTGSKYRATIKQLIEENGFNYFDNRSNKDAIQKAYNISWGLGPYYGNGIYYGPYDTATNSYNKLANAHDTILRGINDKYNLGMSFEDKSNHISDDGLGGSYDGASSGNSVQQALVNKLYSIRGKLKYSLAGNSQNPDKGSGSCASTVGWAYNKVLGLDGMSASSTAQSQDSRFKTIYTNNGSAVVNKQLQPGDIIYENWNRTLNDGTMKHTEMYAGNGQVLTHGGGESGAELGPTLKPYNGYRKAHTMKVRRYKDFANNSYYGLGGISLNDINSRIMGFSGSDNDSINIVNASTRGNRSFFGKGTDAPTTTENNITEKLNVALNATDPSQKLNDIIEIMKEWFDFDKTKPVGNNIIAPTSKASNSPTQTTSKSNSRLMDIHNKIASGKLI